MRLSTGFAPLFHSKLSRFVAFWVFVSLVIIEAIVLIPSYQRRQQEILDQLELVSHEVLAVTKEAAIAGADLDHLREITDRQIQSSEVVVGGRLYDLSDQDPIAFEEPPELRLPEIGDRARLTRLTTDGDRYEIGWGPSNFNGDYALVLRADSTQLDRELWLYTLRIAGLVLIIALVITGTTMYVLGVTVIGPFLKLRNDILAAGEAIALDQPDPVFESLQRQRQDELTQVTDAFQQMYQRVRQEMQQRQEAEVALREEQAKAERLLLNILPEPIAAELKHNPRAIAERFSDVTVLFADLVNFTQLASEIAALDLVNLLNQIFSAFDQLAEECGLEKIKTIGDAYMVVGGVPTARPDHAAAVAAMALAMQTTIQRINHDLGHPFELRIGINTGPVVAGVIGTKKFSYDLWGDAVNLASRMESHGIPGKIQVSPSTY
ncbi:MAG: adenylate/guanylate cyclase domain-containing protein, partial [Cyanobacteria bacterium P01_H01_bin.121]